MSKEHQSYLKKIKKRKRLIILSQIIIIVLFLGLWEVASITNLINSFLYSSPSQICKTIINLFQSNNLINHIYVTLYEVIISFLIVSVLSFIISCILWWNKFISEVVDPYLTILNSLPKVALGPLIIIWVGASTNSIIIMALLIAVFTSTINIYNSFISTNSNYITLLKSMKAKKKDIFFKVILPSNINNLINNCKINVGLILVGVIMGELLVSKSGLGYLIMYGSQVFNINLTITSTFILGIISYLLYLIISKIDIMIKKKQD